MSSRVTHGYRGELAVFLIGLQIHQPWRLGVVGRALRAMPPMLAELEQSRATDRPDGEDLGYLGTRFLWEGRGPTLLQYWRSPEHLYRYATDPELTHRPAWKAFYVYVHQAPEALTVWHETYAVPDGGHESMYVGPARLGLARLDGVVPVSRRGERARDRMGVGS